MTKMCHEVPARPLTIAHVQTRMNRSGGAEENTWASCVHQWEAGHRVHLFCGRSSDVAPWQAKNPNIEVHVVPELVRDISFRSDVAAYRRMTELFAELRPDVVHTHTSKAGIIGRLAARAAKVPIVIHGVHILPFSNVGLAEKVVYLLAEHVVAPFTDHFIHVSNGTRQAYKVTRVGFNKKHSVVRSGMDIDRFKSAEWPEDWRAILGIGENDEKPATILMMAVLEQRKRQSEFIRGLASLTKKGEPIRLLIAGEGPDAEKLAKLVEELDVGDRVRLLGHRKDPERLVALADVCALASLREGLPRSIVQCMAGGRPAIVSPLPGIEEILQNGQNGIVVRSRDAEAVASESVALVRDKARLEQFTRAAAEMNVEDWKFPSMFAQLDKAYEETISIPQVSMRLSTSQARLPASVVQPCA